MTFAEQLERLKTSESFKTLAVWKPAFNPYRALGVMWRELSHSMLLAYLMDPGKPHGLGRNLLDGFLDVSLSAPTFTHGRDISALSEAVSRSRQEERVRVFTELFSVDVVIEFRDTRLVVGVENKIWAGEQERQVERYQDTLRDQYPGWTAFVVFLTPGGYMPSTALADHPNTPCFAVNWSQVGELVRKFSTHGGVGTGEFLSATASHIEEDIMGNGERKKLVRELFANPETREAARAIAEYQPALSDCAQQIKDQLVTLVGAEGFTVSDRWATASEIGCTFGYPPLSLMVHDHPKEDAPPGIFLAAPWKTFEENRPAYEELARRAGPTIDSNFARFKFWWWHRVLASDELEQPGHRVLDAVFDDEFVREILKFAKSYLESVKPFLHNEQQSKGQ